MNVDFTTLEKLFEARKAAKHYFTLHGVTDEHLKKFEYAPGKVTNDSFEDLIAKEIKRLAAILNKEDSQAEVD